MVSDLLTPHEVHRRKVEGECDVHLDVRTPEEYQEFRTPNSVLVPFMLKQGWGMVPNPNFLGDAEAVLGGDHDKRIIVSCFVGGRSCKAAEVLRNAGYRNVSDMKGGLKDYQTNPQLPIEK